MNQSYNLPVVLIHVGNDLVYQPSPSQSDVHHVSVSCGTGKTHIALAPGLSACQKGYCVRFTTAAAMVHELIVSGHQKT